MNWVDASYRASNLYSTYQSIYYQDVANGYSPEYRHGSNQTNLLLMDGHSETLTYDQLGPDPYKTGFTRRYWAF